MRSGGLGSTAEAPPRGGTADAAVAEEGCKIEDDGCSEANLVAGRSFSAVALKERGETRGEERGRGGCTFRCVGVLGDGALGFPRPRTCFVEVTFFS